MKRCPECGRTYTDESLRFCTNDGAPLVTTASSSSDQQATIFAPPSVTEEPQLPPSLQYDEPKRSEPVSWNQPPAYAPPQPMRAPGSWPQPSPQGMPPALTQSRAQTHPLSIISLIAGLIGITFGWLCGGPIFGIAAIVLGLIALVQIKGNPGRYGGKGLAIGGIILGSLWALFILAWALIAIISSVAR